MTYGATSTQKLLAKVGTILTITTDRLLQMRNADLPEVDQIITMNTDALSGPTRAHNV
jgi:hypothetical protein